jgi:hypothetical protein
VAVVVMAALHAGTALAVANLPDARKYELVSPPLKNGGDVMVRGTRTRPSSDGNAVEFASLSAFGDAQGTGIATDYLSERDGRPGTNGWSTHALFPKVDPLSISGATLDLDTSYQADLAADLSTGILRTFTDLSGDSAVGQADNLYLRRDLLTPGPGSYELLTPCPLCFTPLDPTSVENGRPFVADVTPDFGHVLFESEYNLVPGASGPGRKLYEWDHGTLYAAGVLPDGTVAPRSIAGVGALEARYTPHTISSDGSKVFFTTPSTETGDDGPLYMRVNHATTVQLNASERTPPDPAGPQPAQYGTASVDGSKVLFTSDEQLTDTPGRGVYMYDTTLPDNDPHNLMLLSPYSGPANTAPDLFRVLGASDDGSYVYFTANAQLVAGEPATGGREAIYLWHGGVVTYIGVFTEGTDAGLDEIATTWGIAVRAAHVTPDGKDLLFTSHSGVGLTGYDHGSGCPTSNGACTELYRYDAPSDRLSCVSCNPSGAPATTDASFTLTIGTGGSRATSHEVRPMSDDGTRVFFTSGEQLVPEDHNGKRDVYEWEAPGAGSCQASSSSFSASSGGCLYLISSGQSSDDSYFLDASPTGDDVFFATRERLVGWDVDGNYDLYDARVNGGFPEPQGTVSECSGDACQGALSSSPSALGTLATGAPQSSGNVTPQIRSRKKPKPVKCARGKVRKRVHGKVKCVKKKAKKKAKTSRRPRTSRGTK